MAAVEPWIEWQVRAFALKICPLHPSHFEIEKKKGEAQGADQAGICQVPRLSVAWETYFPIDCSSSMLCLLGQWHL